MQKIHSYNSAIDGLRAIAVISVIIYHLKFSIFSYKILYGGFLGVDIFFVISGYLITKQLISYENFNLKNFINFLQRRFKRIVPLTLFVVILSNLLGYFFFLPENFYSLSNQSISSLFYISNYYFYSDNDYWAVSSLFQPLLHTWSLSVEMQFYLFFGFIFLIFSAFKVKKKKNFLITLLVLSLLMWLQFKDKNDAIFYLTPFRVWEFMMGSVIVFINNNRINITKSSNIYSFFAISIIIFSIIAGENTEKLGLTHFNIFIVLGTAILIKNSHKKNFINSFLKIYPLSFIGKISFSLYMWHFPLLAFIRYLGQYYTISEYLKILSVIFLFPISYLSFKFIENFFRNPKFKFEKLIYFFIILIIPLLILNTSSIFTKGFTTRYHPFLNLNLYKNEHKSFKKNYDFNNFDHRKNFFIVGNSYADDMLEVFSKSYLSNKYYFYTVPYSLKNDQTYQIKCLQNLIIYNKFKCNKYSFSKIISKQYFNADKIILAQRGNSFYLTEDFIKIYSNLKKNKKEIIILINNLHGGDILDKFIYLNKRLPNKDELQRLENDFYNKSEEFEKDIIKKVINRFENLEIKYFLKKSYFCNKAEKRCPLIINNKKIFQDSGHLTSDGANYYSINLNFFLSKL